MLQGNWWKRFWIVRYFQKPISGSQSLHLLVFKFSSVQSLSRVRLFVTPWTATQQISLSITNSWSLLKLMSTESGMPSNHLILCRPLLLLPSIFPSIRVFSKLLNTFEEDYALHVCALPPKKLYVGIQYDSIYRQDP